MSVRYGIGAVLCWAVLGCGDKGDLDTGDVSETESDADADTDADTDTDADADTDTNKGEVTGSISGTLRLQLYTEDEDGVREYISWAKAYETYPFGNVFITAYTVGPSGGLDYPGSTVVLASDVDVTSGNTYEIPLTVDSSDEVQVYAAVDYGNDSIIASNEPIGVYPAGVLVEDGDTVEGIDLTVLLPYYDFKTGEGGLDGNGLGNGSGCTDIAVSGNIVVDETGATGLAAAMLIDSSGQGPYDSGFANLLSYDSEGISAGSYSFTTCENYGSFQLRGAWDSNDNELIDPADMWGSYADESGADANPITIATSNLVDYDIQIPLGVAGLTVIPFTELTGTLRVQDGSFDDLPEETTTIYVAAMKYRPSQDMSSSYLYDRSYDVFEIDRADFTGQYAITYSLGVPSDSVMYLWGFADNDGNGIVNEAGEYVGAGGGANGRVLTSEGTNGGKDLAIGVVGG